MTQRIQFLGATVEAVAAARSLMNVCDAVIIVDPDEHARTRVADMLGDSVSVSSDTKHADIVVRADGNLPCPDGAEQWSFFPIEATHRLAHTKLPDCAVLWELPVGSSGTKFASVLGDTGQTVVAFKGNTPTSEKLARAYVRICDELLLHHDLTPARLDEIAQSGGARLGPCALQDVIGLGRVRGDDTPVGRMRTRVLAEGRLGRMASVGWHRYPGGGGQVEDPLVEDLLAEEAHFAGLTRTRLSDDEVLARLRKKIRRAGELCSGAPTNLRTVAALALGWEDLV